MNLGREVGEVISINTQTLSWASKSFSSSLFSFFIADCLSPSVSVKCPVYFYTYLHEDHNWKEKHNQQLPWTFFQTAREI